MILSQYVIVQRAVGRTIAPAVAPDDPSCYRVTRTAGRRLGHAQRVRGV
jgi:predicted secreted Zn-dependent protease